ncbi:MAG: molybdopterin-dependent oxidoreductase, partial [Pseudomonadota bacterium]
RRVAVVGGGPAGLSCAYFLRMKGFGVTLFEQLPRLGGMLRYGIPEYRLPRDVLDREIGFITTDVGVEVRTGTALGKDFTIASLKKDGYEAVFLALGALNSKSMRVDHEHDTQGVVQGLDFLMGQELEGHRKVKGKIVVIGGGNTAVDVARTSLRLGADEVVILYRRTRKEMPADPVEIHDAEAEGVTIQLLAAPVGIERDEQGKLRGLRCIRMELGEPDSSGRRRPVPIDGSEYFLPADIVFPAIGQEPSLACIGGDEGDKLDTTKWKTIVADEETLETNVPGVFAGGDVVSGPDVVIGAIAHGRKAALSIEEYLAAGKADTRKASEFISSRDYYGIPQREWEAVEKADRRPLVEMDEQERIGGFDEVSKGLSGDSVKPEAMRCLECGCQVQLTCRLKKIADEYHVDISRFKGEVRRGKIDDRHPFIRIDNNKCILCARCIRTCGEMLGISALGFVGRGFKTEVHPALRKPLQETTCISCGNCADACPTGAIISRPPFFEKILPVHSRRTLTTCHACSVGCRMDVEAMAVDLFRISAGECDGFDFHRNSPNKGYLCVKGRYNIQYMMDGSRLREPLVKKGGKLEPASWDDAVAAAWEGLSAVAKSRGPQGVAVLGAPYRTNEELYLLQKLARLSLGTSNVGSFTKLAAGGDGDAVRRSMGATASTTDLEALENADVVLVAGGDIDEENFVAGMLARLAVRGGAKLIVVGTTSRLLDRFATLRLEATKGTEGALLTAVGRAVLDRGNGDEAFTGENTTGFEEWKTFAAVITPEKAAAITGVEAGSIVKAAELVGDRNAKVVALFGLDSPAGRGAGDLGALVNLMLLTGNAGNVKAGSGIILLESSGNAQGARDMGMTPEHLPGYEDAAKASGAWGAPLDLQGAKTAAALREALDSGKIKGLLIFGEDPCVDARYEKLLDKAEFSVVMETAVTRTAGLADVVLPLCTMVETSGTLTSCERRVQRVGRAFEPGCGREGWQVLSELLRKGSALEPPSDSFAVWKEIERIAPIFAGIEIETLDEKPFSWSWSNGFKTAGTGARFVPVDLDGPVASGAPPYQLYSKAYLDLMEKYLKPR